MSAVSKKLMPASTAARTIGRPRVLVEDPRPPGAVAVAHHAETDARDVEAGAAEANLLHHGAFLE